MTEAAPAPATTPDVTVVIPVYNTMPYLTACLQSMVDQSIGADRMEVVAVDDGSTDGGGEELERFAADHPGLFTVLHQENSGGPAGPCNRGLEVARGRYVFFVGADDYLADNALEKLVEAADAWESDVIWGKVEGVGGRGISQLMFDRTRKDIPFPDSKLPFALANSKMFRRSLIEEHGIRYPLDLRVGSDQPFTIAAMLHARRISVLADQTYYYGVRRENASNISFSSTWRARLEDIGSVMDHVAEIVGPGEKRDRILHRHFAWELNRRLRDQFPELPEEEQAELAGLVADLADRYLTDAISDRLTVQCRLRVRYAQAGRLEDLRALARFVGEGRPEAVAVRDGRACLVLPGYGDAPDAWFESRAENLVQRLDEAARVTTLAWDGAVLDVVAAAPLLHPDSAGSVWLQLHPLPGTRRVGDATRRPPELARRRMAVARVAATVEPAVGGTGSVLRASVDLAPLLGRAPGERRRWAPRLVLDAGDRVFDLPLVTAEGVEQETTTLVHGAGSWHRLVARVGRQHRLVLVRRPVPAGEVPRSMRLRATVSRLQPR